MNLRRLVYRQSVWLLLDIGLIYFQASAQVSVTSKVAESPYDISARTEKRFDLNGMGCALVKIEIPIENVSFEGNIIVESQLRTNEYWVYMTDGSKKLKVHIPGYSNLLLEFAPLASLRTYIAAIEVLDKTRPVSIADAVFDYENRAKTIVADSSIITNLRQEAFRHMLTSRDVSHIMLPVGKTPDERIKNMQTLDSIRAEILNGASFEGMALKYSIDPTVRGNKGHMGFITNTSFPYPFIEAAYATEIGGVSAAFDDSPYGIHIVKVEAEKPNPGKYLVRHIMKNTSGLSESEKSNKLEGINDVYMRLLNGEDFANLALIESEDKGSSKNGGKLPWFGAGQMIQEFETAVEVLQNGEISKPFETKYGYHIVQRIDSRELSYDEELPNIDNAIAKDIRVNASKKEKLARLRRLYGINLIPNGLDVAHKIIDGNGGLDLSSISALQTNSTVLAKFGNKELTVSDVASVFPVYENKVRLAAIDEFDRIAYEQLDAFTEEIVRMQLSAYPDIVKHLDD